MLAKVYSYGIDGLDAFPVCIEVDVTKGLPSTVIVGLPDNAVKESKERVRSAIRNSGYKFTAERVTVNLSPADIKKEGPSFDLAIALGILAATKQINAVGLENFIILGELSLDGGILPIHGSLCIALSIPFRRFKGVILPSANAREATVNEHINIYPVQNLSQAIAFLNDNQHIKPSKFQKPCEDSIENNLLDFSDVKGQFLIKRGLEVAAAGGHNVFLIGPPGSGKTMLAQRLPTILPDMTRQEALETTKIHSIMGLIQPQTGLLTQRPFRSPHHTSSDIALVGGGSGPRPGEVTLAHNGILFLDELPEFNRNVLEALRQPLEDNYVVVSRAAKTLKFPARFILIAALNPCPCGWYADRKKECICSSQKIEKYMSKISGPLLDRIDIHLEVSSLKSEELLSLKTPETSSAIKERTTRARQIQKERFKNSSIFSNAQMNHRQVKHFCSIDEAGRTLLKSAIDELGLSARAYDKIIKVSRTISDLAGSQNILSEHIAEAIQYRTLDRRGY